MVGAYLARAVHVRASSFRWLWSSPAAASGGALPGARLGRDAAFALLLLAQFRSGTTWPIAVATRSLTRSASSSAPTSIAPIVAFSGALAILNICLAVQRDASGIAVAVLVALIGALGAWYSLRTCRTAAGDHLLLSKYPAMVIVVAGERVLHAPVQILLCRARAPCRGLSSTRCGTTRPARSRSEDIDDVARHSQSATGGRSSNRSAATSAARTEHDDFITAEDDLGGTPGTFRFVRCTRCGLAYQNPRVALEHIGAYYDDEYIAHRQEARLGRCSRRSSSGR